MFYHGFLKVATSSPKVSVGDPMANVDVMLRALQVAQDHQAGILVFPELSICGYTCQDLLFQEYLYSGRIACRIWGMIVHCWTHAFEE